MKLRDLLAGVPLSGGAADLEMEINSISTEPETLCPGALYVELPGSGLTADQALERGACAAVGPGESRGRRLGTDAPWRTLTALAANWYCHPARRMTVTVVAGEGDSALVAHLLRLVLERTPRARVGVIEPDGVWLRGTRLPGGQRTAGGLCVQRLLRRMADEGCTHAVVRLGSRELERGEGEQLSPAVTVLTGPAPAGEERDGLLRRSQTVVFNLDEPAWKDYRSIIPARTFTYSENKPQADLTAENLRLFPGHVEFEAVTAGQIQRIHLPVPGGYTHYHGLCVLACGLCLGLRLDRMARTLRCAPGPGGRLEVLSVPAAYTVVLDDAAAPEELERTLTCAREFTAKRLICLLGCPAGEDAELWLRLGAVAEQLADRLVLTGDGAPPGQAMAAIRGVLAGTGGWDRPCQAAADRQQAVRQTLRAARPGDVIVVAGVRPAALDRERAFIFDCVRPRGRRESGVPANA